MAQNCTRCGAEIESWDDNYFGRGMLCPNCHTESMTKAGEKTSICTRCGLRITPQSANLKTGTTLCQKCYDDVLKEHRERYCAICKKLIEGASFEREDGMRLCLKCMQDQSHGGGDRRQAIRACDKCGRMAVVRFVTAEGRNLCTRCAQSNEAGKGLLSSLADAIRRLRR